MNTARQRMEEPVKIEGPLWRLDATAQAELVRTRQVSALELVEAAISRIEATHAALNAVVLPCFDEARRTARALDAALSAGKQGGPLAGVPITIKDQFRVAGLPTTLALPSRKASIDRDEGPLVSRLREAGAVILGKTATPQLLFGFETESKLYGRTNNPWNKERSPAASSGGEAANLAAGGAALGLGGDLGGSVRAPAHVTGLFGLRSSVGRLSLLDSPKNTFTPLFGLSPVAGPLARSARDLGLAMSVLHKEGALDPTVVNAPLGDWRQVPLRGLRVGFFDDDGYVRPSPAVRRAVHEAAAALAAQGAQVEPVAPPPSERALQLTMSLLGAEGGANIRRLLTHDTPDPALAGTLRGMGAPAFLLSLVTWVLARKGEGRMSRLLAGAGRKTATQLAELIAERETMRGAALAQLEDQRLDIVLCPPCAVVAARHGFPEQGMLTASYTFLYSLLDLPAGVAPVTTVRAGEECDRALVEPADKAFAEHEAGTAGLPCGVQVVGRPFREDVVIAAMAGIERELSGRPGYPVTPVNPS